MPVEPVPESVVTVDRTLRLPDASPGRRVVLPEDLKKLLQDFQKAREVFDQQREDLLKQTRGASEADRAKFRELFQDIRRQFLEQQRQVREEVRRRMEELKQELPQRQELIDAAKEKTRDRRGRDGEGKKDFARLRGVSG